MDFQEIISKLPYSYPFLFVDELLHIDETSSRGVYTFRENSFFYQGHFKGNPVTPGVILTECMAQLGVVCLGIYLLDRDQSLSGKEPKIALSSTDVEFFFPVFPGETVKVVSEKQYFRFNKLKCEVKMFNVEEKLVARGKIAGMCSFREGTNVKF